MSVLDQLDVSKYFNGEMDRWIEKRYEMLEFFKGKELSVLIIDPNNEMPLDVIEGALPDLSLKPLIWLIASKAISTGQVSIQYNIKCAYDGLLFDNIDCINAGKDTKIYK